MLEKCFYHQELFLKMFKLSPQSPILNRDFQPLLKLKGSQNVQTFTHR